MKCNKCNKCGCLVDEYYHSYKYNGLDYCCDCMLETLVDEGVIEETSLVSQIQSNESCK